MRILKLTKRKKISGQVLMEPIVAIAIIGLVLGPFVAYLGNLVRSQTKYRHQAQAAHYAREGVEIVYNIAVNANWEAFTDNLNLPDKFRDDGRNPPALVAGETNTTGRFTRETQIEKARRDTQGNITAGGGQEDPNTLKVTSKVTWEEKEKIEEISFTTYLINLSL